MAKNDKSKTTQNVITNSVKKLPKPRPKKTSVQEKSVVLSAVEEKDKIIVADKNQSATKSQAFAVDADKINTTARQQTKSAKPTESKRKKSENSAAAGESVAVTDSTKTAQGVKKTEAAQTAKTDRAVQNADVKKNVNKKKKNEPIAANADVVEAKESEQPLQDDGAAIVSEQKTAQSVEQTDDTQVNSTSSQEDNKEDEIKAEIVQKPRKKKNKKKFNTPLQRVQPDPAQGLSAEQVQERMDRGLNNEQPNIVTKSYAGIFRSNVLTLFNVLNFFLATMILIYGEFKNALFMGTVIVNMIVGIVQEIRSKLTLEKMSIMSTPKIRVVRDGKIEEIDNDELVLDDIFVLRQGEQVPADSVLVEGMCEVNESLLTGEQDDVHKEIGSELLSGSFIQAGDCKARACAVGKDNYTSKLMTEAKQFKKPKSELMKSINWIIRIVTIAIFPIGILMFYTNFKTTATINQAVTATVASIVGMIPEGLVMLTSIALAAGIIKLAKKRTLVQDLYCIETLARVDVLCLDKTGTITEGSMQVEETHVYSTKYGFVDDIMTNMVAALGNSGATFEAFDNYFKSSERYDVIKTIPFSSSRKWSGADFGDKGRFIVGAPEFVLKSRFGLVESDALEYTSQGYRVLVLVKTTEQLKENMDENKMRPIALIVLSDKIRENAKKTFEYFAKQGVNLKVISGDNPITVSKVAERAGLMGADKFIDASVDLDTPEKIYDACDKYTIFGRVSPKQKKILVQSLKQKGYTVGMTGDGVNDVMALKEADCSIAMASGSEASRNVAQLVLLDSDFSALPSVVAEGRRVINNIERAASLFLVKTTYSLVLSLLLIIFQMNYPFVPIQLTVISMLFVGLPSFFLALEPNDTKVSGSFLSKVFKKAVPAGLTVAFLVWLISYIYRDIGLDVSAQISTMSFFVTSMVAVVVLLQVCMPYNKERLFLIAMALVIFIAAVSSDYVSSILSLVPLTTDMIIKTVIFVVCAPLMILFMRAEVEAIKALFKEIKGFFVGLAGKARELVGKRKDERK
ncbi:MAG: cation-translocating P-type ATPase [Christensenellales bacterium]